MLTPSRIMAVGFAILSLMLAAGGLQTQAQDQRGENPVKSVTKFKVPPGEMATFIELTQRANDVYEQHGSVAEVRVWVDNLAGPETGTVIHTKEYPSFEAMAADYALVHPTPEWQEFLTDFNASGVEVVSNSLQWELIP